MSAPPRTLRAGHTHLYPGARLRGEPAALRRDRSVNIEFADLGSAPARIEAVDSGCATLAVGAHLTARGTSVAAKRWLVESAAEGEWRVLKRLSDDG